MWELAVALPMPLRASGFVTSSVASLLLISGLKSIQILDEQQIWYVLREAGRAKRVSLPVFGCGSN